MYWIIGYILCIEVNEESCKANNNKNHPSFTAGRRTCGFVQLFGWNCPAEQLGGNIQIVWKRLGLPHGKYSKFQMAPVVLWQGPAGPCSQGGGTSMETCWRMDEKCFRGSEEWRKKKNLWESTLWTPRPEKGEWEEVFQVPIGAIATLQPVEEPTLEQWVFLEGTAAFGRPTLEEAY